jgi:D-alanine-D-alanine ligase
VVKPRAGGSGIGVSLVRDEAELEVAVEVALRLDDDVLVERWAGETEVQVALLDGQVLGGAEVLASAGIAGPRRAGRPADVIAPPRIGAERLRGVVTQALRAHHLVGCSGVARVDVLLSERGNESILEVETLPDLSPGSLVGFLARERGLDFPDLVERVLHGARLHAGRRTRTRNGLGWSAPERRVGIAAEPH